MSHWKAGHIMKLKLFFKKIFEEQNGAVAIVAATVMVALLGFSALVADLGIVYVEASRLQNALDSAVLAALVELPAGDIYSQEWQSAQNTVIAYAAFNDFDLNPSDIHPVYENSAPSGRITGIEINKSIQVNYNFARVLGIDSTSVSRSSVSGLVPAGGLTGAVPLCISSSALTSAIEWGIVENITIKCSSGTDDMGTDYETVSGWFGPLRFEGNGASSYTQLLKFGYDSALCVGDVLDIESGNMSGPTLDGISDRVNRCTGGCTPESYETKCPKLIYIPVVEIIADKQVQVVGFAAFFITEYGGSGKDSFIKATYLSDVIVSSSESGADGADFGIYTRKLLG